MIASAAAGAFDFYGQHWGVGSGKAFAAELRAHGVNPEAWKARHPQAARTFIARWPANTKPRQPGKCLRWFGECWSYENEGGAFAWRLHRLNVLTSFVEKRPAIARRFSGGYWPPSEATMRRAIRDTFPQSQWSTWECIIGRESGWWPWAVGDVTLGGSYGFLQFHRPAHAGRLIPAHYFESGQVFDVRVQVRTADRLSGHGTRLSPWRGGRFHCF